MPRTPQPLHVVASVARMTAKDRGNKFVCFKCSTKFFDLKKPAPICPKCGADQREHQAAQPSEKRRGRGAAAPKVVDPVVSVVEPAAVDEDAELEGIEEEDES